MDYKSISLGFIAGIASVVLGYSLYNNLKQSPKRKEEKKITNY